jgi:hypothetical protein
MRNGMKTSNEARMPAEFPLRYFGKRPVIKKPRSGSTGISQTISIKFIRGAKVKLNAT